MGRRIKTNFKDEFNLWSSNIDDYIATFDNKNELLNFIASEKVYDGMSVNDDIIYIAENRDKANKEYFDFVDKINSESETYEEYYEKINSKLNELLKKNKKL